MAIKYRIYREGVLHAGAAGATQSTADIDAPPFNITGQTASTSADWTVRAYDTVSAEESVDSSALNVTQTGGVPADEKVAVFGGDAGDGYTWAVGPNWADVDDGNGLWATYLSQEENPPVDHDEYLSTYEGGLGIDAGFICARIHIRFQIPTTGEIDTASLYLSPYVGNDPSVFFNIYRVTDAVLSTNGSPALQQTLLTSQSLTTGTGTPKSFSLNNAVAWMNSNKGSVMRLMIAGSTYDMGANMPSDTDSFRVKAYSQSSGSFSTDLGHTSSQPHLYLTYSA